MTVKYKDRSYLQSIGRIRVVAKNTGKRQRSFDLDDDIRPARRVKVDVAEVDSDTKRVSEVKKPLVIGGVIKSE
jgi:hypothetical protein